MEPNLTVAAGVRRLTVNIDQDDVELFEGLWPVPEGVALHAYLVEGQRRVVVDPWDAGGYGPEEVGADLEDLGLAWKDVAAVAFTKAPAPDLMARLRVWAPKLEDWGLPVDGSLHDLGAGVTLEAREGQWFVAPAGVALTGDAFAGLGWIEDEVWAEELSEDADRYFEGEALRWFAQRPLVPALPAGTKVVAPAHGPLFREPQEALDRAREFASWAAGPGLDEIAVVWPAGEAAEEGALALVGAALEVGVDLVLYRVPGDEATALAAGARRASLVVVAAGLDEGFLAGLTKPLWRPAASEAPAALREGLKSRWP